MPTDTLPDDSESLKRLLLAREAELAVERSARAVAEAEASRALTLVKSSEATIAHLKLLIEKLKRAQYDERSERGERLSISSSCSSRKPRPRPASTSRKPMPPAARRYGPSPVARPAASRYPSTCRASG